jgi:transcription antitermination factor NusG
MNSQIPWFALQTEPRREKKVAFFLEQKGYEFLLPMYRQKRRWTHRTVTMELPLFPGYIFCRFDSSVSGTAVSTPGVSRIVGFGGQPSNIPSDEINSLQLLAGSTLLREPWAYIPDGTLVQIETGPLAGAEGIICADNDRRRLVISVSLLQRSVAVQLDDNTVVSVIDGPRVHKVPLSNESAMVLGLIGKRNG